MFVDILIYSFNSSFLKKQNKMQRKLFQPWKYNIQNDIIKSSKQILCGEHKGIQIKPQTSPGEQQTVLGPLIRSPH